MKKIHAVKLANKVNVTITTENGIETLSKTFNENQDAIDLMLMVRDFNQKNSDELFEKIFSTFDRKYFLKKKCNGLLEYDPRTNLTYLAGFNTPIPNGLVDTIEEYVEIGYPLDSVVNFWSLLMANPNKEVREGLFKYITDFDLSITDNGYFVVYKSVAKLNVNTIVGLADFVSSEYLKVKRHKKSPKNFVVYREYNTDDDGDEVYTLKSTEKDRFSKWEEDVEGKNVGIVGNLDELNKNIDRIIEEEDGGNQLFTPIHTLSLNDHDPKKQKIQLGVPVTQERRSCDSNSSIDCSYGLHVGASNYVNNFGRSVNDNVILVCLVNPMNVVALPYYDHSKIRVCEYFPIGISELDEAGNIIPISTSYFEDDYSNYEMENLQRIIDEVKSEEGCLDLMGDTFKDERNKEEIIKILEKRVNPTLDFYNNDDDWNDDWNDDDWNDDDWNDDDWNDDDWNY